MAPGRLESLLELLPAAVPEPRDPKSRWPPWRAIVGIVVLAKVSSVTMGQRQIPNFAQRLTQPQRCVLRCCRAENRSVSYLVPAESTYRGALTAWEWEPIHPPLLCWQDRQLGHATDPLIAIDRKQVKRSGGRACASGQPSQRVHVTVTLAKDEREATAAYEWRAQTDFADQLLALDSLHLKHATVPQILFYCGADYLLPTRATNRRSRPSPARSCPRPFPPQEAFKSEAYRVSGQCEETHGHRIERWCILRDETSGKLGLAGAAQPGLIIGTVTEQSRTTTTRLLVVTSRASARLDATDMLSLRRGQWGIAG